MQKPLKTKIIQCPHCGQFIKIDVTKTKKEAY